MVAVSVTDGLAYGLRTVAVFGVLLVVAAVLTAVGVNMATTARTYGIYGASTDWGRFLLGGALSLAGGLTLYAGSMGLLYKVVADGVRRGNSRAV
ncbi:hypothetical protein [Halosimplex halophilum]|uniref:hypothetical protein n=1 Tax=Halosimplex halophilum TaxID=2559572 RepID=UPI00107EEEAD|nr:hypothetical protein [Halosimplex halophilum]